MLQRVCIFMCYHSMEKSSLPIQWNPKLQMAIAVSIKCFPLLDFYTTLED